MHIAYSFAQKYLILHKPRNRKYNSFKDETFRQYSEDESVSRVILRSQTGGHDVTDEVIRFNFNEGLKNAKQYLHLFENLTFIDGSSDFGKIIAIHVAKSHIHEVIEHPPMWFTEQFREAFDAL